MKSHVEVVSGGERLFVFHDADGNLRCLPVPSHRPSAIAMFRLLESAFPDANAVMEWRQDRWSWVGIEL